MHIIGNVKVYIGNVIYSNNQSFIHNIINIGINDYILVSTIIQLSSVKTTILWEGESLPPIRHPKP